MIKVMAVVEVVVYVVEVEWKKNKYIFIEKGSRSNRRSCNR